MVWEKFSTLHSVTKMRRSFSSSWVKHKQQQQNKANVKPTRCLSVVVVANCLVCELCCSPHLSWSSSALQSVFSTNRVGRGLCLPPFLSVLLFAGYLKNKDFICTNTNWPKMGMMVGIHQLKKGVYLPNKITLRHKIVDMLFMVTSHTKGVASSGRGFSQKAKSLTKKSFKHIYKTP